MTSSPNSTPHRNVYTPKARGGVSAVLRDIRDGVKHSPIWTAFAWNDIQKRYRRSILGLAWIVISYYFFVVVITIFFSGFASKSIPSFACYVAVGYAAFSFIVSNISDGCNVFKTSSTWIKSMPLPYSIYIYKSIAKSGFIFVVHLAAAFLILPFLGWRPTMAALFAVPAVILFLVNAIWFQLFFGLIATRWRDITHLISTITRLLFLTTPILWVYEERTGIRKELAGYNPLTHFLEIFRTPILGEPAQLQSWLVVIGCTIIGWIVAIAAASKMQRRLPFWV